MTKLEGIRPLSKSTWAIRVKRVDASTGKICNRKATVIGTKTDAIRKRDDIRAELANSTKRERVRFGAFAIAWLARRTIKGSTRHKYENGLAHILPELGEIFVDTLAPSMVVAYLAMRVLQAAGNTVLNELRLLRVMARDSLAEGLASRYWCERVRAPKVARYTDERPNLFTAEQVARVLEHVPPQWLGILSFMLTTGVRFGEASALRWEDVDVAELVFVRIHRGNYRGTEITVKNDNSVRVVPVLREVLALWGLRRDRGLVFPTRKGTMHRGSPLRRVLTKACAAAGVVRVTTHGLRRTFNNEGRQAGSKEVVKSITGHGTDAMFEWYSHVGAGEKAELARAIATRIGVLKVSAPRTKIEANP